MFIATLDSYYFLYWLIIWNKCKWINIYFKKKMKSEFMFDCFITTGNFCRFIKK